MLSHTRWNDKQTKLIDVEPWKLGVRFGDKSHGRNPESEGVREQFERFQASKVWFLCALDTGLRKSDVTTLPRRSVRFKDRVIRKVMRKTGRKVVVPLASTLEKVLKDSMKRSGDVAGTEEPIIVHPSG